MQFKHVTLCFLLLTSCLHKVYTQDLQDARMVGILSFGTHDYEDSIAAKNIYSAVSRILVQTKRFTVMEMDKWQMTQEEIDRQQSAGFLDRDIIQRGKSLGAQVLIVGFVKNAEVYYKDGNYAARVDYELKYIDVETGKTIAAAAFTGDSDNKLAAKAGNLAKGIKERAGSLLFRSYEGYKAAAISDAALKVLSNSDKEDVHGKTIDAIEASAAHLRSWIHKTFDFSLLLLQTLDEDKKKGFQSVLVEGGEDIGLKKGLKLKMVLVTIMETSRGKIRDEEPIAELEVQEVRAQTSKCKVLSGGKRIQEVAQNKNMRIVFN